MKFSFKKLVSKIKTSIKEIFLNNEKRSIFLIVAISATCVLGLFSAAAITAVNAPDYIYIKTEEDLEYIRQNPNGSFIFEKQNIAISNPDWEPIGTKDEPFTGNIEGNGCTLSFTSDTLQCNEENYFGFIGYNKGTIRNLTFYQTADINVIPNLNSSNDVVFGTIASFNYGSLSNCKFNSGNTGSIIIGAENCDVYAGGLSGIGGHNFAKCYSSVHFSIGTNGLAVTGTILGKAEVDCDVWECQAAPRTIVNCSSSTYCGGLIGLATCEGYVIIQNCCLRGDIANESQGNGILCGIIAKTEKCKVQISNCFVWTRIKNSENNKCSMYFGEGDYEVRSSICYPNFINIGPEMTFGPFGYEFNENNVVEKCYYDNSLNGACNSYGELIKRSELSVSFMGWNENIWVLNNDGSFKLA